MKTEKSICKSESCILVEGPRYGDTTFYGQWLLSAAKANELLRQAKKDDPEFCKAIDTLEGIHLLDINIAATRFMSQFADKELYTFVINTTREDIDAAPGEHATVEHMTDPGEHMDFILMAEMGFFALTGDRYQMTLPQNLDMDKGKQAPLKLAATEDKNWIHPERLFVDMPYSEATKYQHLLRAMYQGHRLAERQALH
jgi:hypothetical protein